MYISETASVHLGLSQVYKIFYYYLHYNLYLIFKNKCFWSTFYLIIILNNWYLMSIYIASLRWNWLVIVYLNISIKPITMKWYQCLVHLFLKIFQQRTWWWVSYYTLYLTMYWRWVTLIKKKFRFDRVWTSTCIFFTNEMCIGKTERRAYNRRIQGKL